MIRILSLAVIGFVISAQSQLLAADSKVPGPPRGAQMAETVCWKMGFEVRGVDGAGSTAA